jgi:hypothetical protein
MEPIDLGKLVSEMQAAASGVIGKDVATLGGFSAEQLQDIGKQAIMVSAGIADGSIAGETRGFLLNSLKEMAHSFVNTLVGLIAVVAEEIWNAIVGVLWAAIGKATGLALPVP